MNLEDSYVGSHGPEGQTVVDRGPHLEGYMARARTIMNEDACVSSETCVPESRRDFIATLRLLGSVFGNGHDNSAMEDSGDQNRFGVFLSCSLEAWTQVFGKPQNVGDGDDSSVWVPFRIWEHQTVDGPLRCFGHLFERVPGEQWVILARVCSF
jgi:hypothetical protein